jgi:type IV secretory pathway VirB10-like protein
MLSNRAALGALLVVGVVAAASGAYIAGRAHPAADIQAPAASAHDVTLPSAPGVVTETENSLAGPTPAGVAAAPVTAAPAAKPATPVRSASADRRPASRSRTASPTADRSRGMNFPSASSSSTSASAGAPATQTASSAAEPVESAANERRTAVPEVPQKQYQELVVPADSVVGLQIENAISSDRAKVEDPVHARVSRDVKVRDQVAIPAGSRAEGSITLVEKGGRLKDQARLGIRFHTIVLADGTRLPINTETIYREGESPARQSAAKIGGGAVGGAVLGAILGGKKGAIIGSTVGAGAGGAAVMASDASTATLPAGSTVTVRMSAPATVTVEK